MKKVLFLFIPILILGAENTETVSSLFFIFLKERFVIVFTIFMLLFGLLLSSIKENMNILKYTLSVSISFLIIGTIFKNHFYEVKNNLGESYSSVNKTVNINEDKVNIVNYGTSVININYNTFNGSVNLRESKLKEKILNKAHSNQHYSCPIDFIFIGGRCIKENL